MAHPERMRRDGLLGGVIDRVPDGVQHRAKGLDHPVFKAGFGRSEGQEYLTFKTGSFSATKNLGPPHQKGEGRIVVGKI